MRSAPRPARDAGRRRRLWILGGLCLLLVLIAFAVRPIAQDPAYHDFADQRMMLGVPNAINVLSNVPYLLVGVWGLAFLARDWSAGAGLSFLTPAERWPYWILFAGWNSRPSVPPTTTGGRATTRCSGTVCP